MKNGHTIVTSMQKGGVGKTTFVFNLANGLVQRGNRVLVIDNDPQGDLTQSFLGESIAPQVETLKLYSNASVRPQMLNENLDLIGADIGLSVVQEKNFNVIFDFAEQVGKIKEGYDFILIDSLPSFGLMHTAGLLAADYVIIPVKPAPFSLKAVKMLLETIAKVQRPRLNPELEIIGMILNHVEASQTLLGKEIERKLRQHYGEVVFKNSIRRTVRLEESPAFQSSIFEYDPKGKATTEFNLIVDELCERCNKKKVGENKTNFINVGSI